MAALALTAAVACPGCAALGAALPALALGAQWLGTVLDIAQAGATAYHARHPNQSQQDRATAALTAARDALAALEQALLDSRDPEAYPVRDARLEALRRYGELRALLRDAGVLDARPPAGGAEADAPLPAPLALPTVDDLAARLR